MNTGIALRANAKINLLLKVFDLRGDGFHNIETIMQSISLHDIVTLEPVQGKIIVKCDDPEVPLGEDNLAYKAAQLYFKNIEARDEGIEISIKKNIPMAAGLGGGSADAAAVLNGLNLINNSRLHKTKLIELASQLGSDVPFCLIGGTAKCTGRGEIVKKINPESGNTFILAMPDIKVATKLIYEAFDKSKKNESALNDLEQITLSKYDEIRKLKEELESLTKLEWIMSGSGPVLFAEFRDLAEINGTVEKVSKICKYHVAMRMNEGISVMEDLE